MKKIVLIFIPVSLILFLFIKLNNKELNKGYLLSGQANPGQITILNHQDNYQKIIKTFDTDYKFVYSIRSGDIYHNGKKYIIAGVSNSFYA